MEGLIQHFILLPKVIQDIIYEYNASHRSMLYLVHRELIQKLVHMKTMKYVFTELEQRVYRYDCIKCKNCYRWFYETDTDKDPIFGKPIYCTFTCRFHAFYKNSNNPKFRNKYCYCVKCNSLS